MTDNECYTCYRVNSSRLKQISSCLNSSRKQRVSLQNLCRNIKFTPLFGKITHTFTKKLLNIYIFTSISKRKRTKLNYINIYAALLLAKIAAIYVFLECKNVGPKIWSCKIFDKFQFCEERTILTLLNLMITSYTTFLLSNTTPPSPLW